MSKQSKKAKRAAKGEQEMNATEYTIDQSGEIQAIIVQFESCEFKDKHGHKLEMNTSFEELKKIANGKRNLEIQEEDTQNKK